MTFRRIQPPHGETVTVHVEQRAVTMAAGESVAAALLAAGLAHTRESPISGAPRAPWCMMGVCFECLVSIDGDDNRQACMTPVREGMRIALQRGAPALTP